MTQTLDDIFDGLMGRHSKREKIRPPRPVRTKTREPKIYFDADRFRWYFHKREGRTLQQWRDAIDEEMRNEEAQCPQTD